jgi:hypothetical protein
MAISPTQICPFLGKGVRKWGANLDKMPPDLRFNSLPEDRRSAPSNIPLRAVTFMPFGNRSNPSS